MLVMIAAIKAEANCQPAEGGMVARLAIRPILPKVEKTSGVDEFITTSLTHCACILAFNQVIATVNYVIYVDEIYTYIQYMTGYDVMHII